MYVLLHVIYFLKLSYFEITSDYFLNKHDRATYVSQSETKRNVCFFFFFLKQTINLQYGDNVME